MAGSNFTTAFLREGNEVVVHMDCLYVKTRTGKNGQVNSRISNFTTCFSAFYYRQLTIVVKEKE